MNFWWWRHAQIVWCHSLCLKIPLFQEDLEQAFLLTSSTVQTSLRNQKNLIELEIIYQNAIYIYIPWYSRICWIPVQILMSAEFKGCVICSNILRYGSTKFHHCKICGTDFREGRTFCSPPSASSHMKVHTE